jgi:hypothetical protein
VVYVVLVALVRMGQDPAPAQDLVLVGGLIGPLLGTGLGGSGGADGGRDHGR